MSTYVFHSATCSRTYMDDRLTAMHSCSGETLTQTTVIHCARVGPENNKRLVIRPRYSNQPRGTTRHVWLSPSPCCRQCRQCSPMEHNKRSVEVVNVHWFSIQHTSRWIEKSLERDEFTFPPPFDVAYA